MAQMVLSGDEAVAQAALDAGLMGGFAYPGTPSTEIMEYLQEHIGKAPAAPRGIRVAQWCANEKTAYESALGVSFVGGRAMVSMKHVGLNVAMDPFVNSALVRINGGLVVVVADDPSMHSSQNEQDSRLLADFARIPCYEPSDQQEAYDMTRQAFEYSERHEVPVLLRLTTRLAHARAQVSTSDPIVPTLKGKCTDPYSWILMPAMARRRWQALLEKQAIFRTDHEVAASLALRSTKLGVITTGLGLRYYLENEEDWAAAHGGERPSHLHIGRYPIGTGKIRQLLDHVDRVLVIEEGYPYIERDLVGMFGAPRPVDGKLSGALPLMGELSADSVRTALGLPQHEAALAARMQLPGRPPQFCQGCPHADSITALKAALEGEAEFFTASDIGCYTLSALPPWNAVDSCVDMGASAGMSRGAGAIGQKKSIGMIGDSTFYHSGMTNLVDAVKHKTPMTLIILDNGATGMTGAQPTISGTSQLPSLLEGLGVEKEHIRVLEAHRRNHEANVQAIREELAYEGVSVIVLVRECLEWLKKVRAS
ncbi:MAG: thiamine pyrophosphate-dependent enzyme [Rectinemataceae bacterium]|nr:thiamine pyrophosphate-dependent enzyme [Spirochaetaceae bacterium]